jgi:hypothetical protein
VPRTLPFYAVLAVIAALSLSPRVEGAEQSSSATTLSAYGDYAKEVAAECVRNRAYGLSTGGVTLPVFCARLGNEKALLKHRQLNPDPQGPSVGGPFPSSGRTP